MAKRPDGKTEKKEPKLVARDNWYRFNEADTSGHRAYVKTAQKANRFYAGEQWDPADLKTLGREGRPALTLNMILSTVNAMIGEQLERKVEGVFRSNGDASTDDTAFALNKITRCILQMNMFDDVEETVFADGLITGRGYYDVRLSFKNNIQGEIAITSDDPIDVIIDPEAKEMDPSTWSEVFISRWMTVDEVGEEYGWDKADEIEGLADSGSARDDNFEYFDQTYGGISGQHVTSADDSRRLRRVRVIERQHYVVDSQFFFVNKMTGDLRPCPHGVKKDECQKMADEMGALLVKRKGRRVRITTSVDDVLLYDDWSIYRSFTIVPFFPYFRRGNPFGVVQNLFDPQNLLNKTTSQELHIVNSTANSGWVIEEDSLVDMDAEDLEERGAETGLVLQYKKGAKEPEKIKPNSIPSGIDRISNKAANTIREISAINASMAGAARADMSGVAQEKSIQRGQVQVSVVLNNLKRARLLVLKKILELVQDFFTETRYFTVKGDGIMDDGENVEVGINVPTEAGSSTFLNDVTLGRYDIEVGVRPSGGSLAQQELEEAMRLREVGVEIPDHVVVQYSSLRDRNAIAEYMKNAAGLGEPSEEEAALQDMQITHQIEMLKKELEGADAEIQLKLADAEEKRANAETLEDYKKIDVEMAQLRLDKRSKEMEYQLRISLAAKGHENAGNMNDKRISSQVAMKSMDMAIASNKEKSDTSKKPAQKSA